MLALLLPILLLRVPADTARPPLTAVWVLETSEREKGETFAAWLAVRSTEKLPGAVVVDILPLTGVRAAFVGPTVSCAQGSYADSARWTGTLAGDKLLRLCVTTATSGTRRLVAAVHPTSKGGVTFIAQSDAFTAASHSLFVPGFWATFVTALLGFLAGVLAPFLTKWLEDWHQGRKNESALRLAVVNQLYVEFAQNERALRDYVENRAPAPATMQTTGMGAVVFKDGPLSFISEPERAKYVEKIKRLHSAIQDYLKVKRDSTKSDQEVMEAAKKLLGEFERLAPEWKA